MIIQIMLGSVMCQVVPESEYQLLSNLNVVTPVDVVTIKTKTGEEIKFCQWWRFIKWVELFH